MFDKIAWIPALIVLLGILVIFHEFGHFAVAKLFKIRVDEFAFGFGPKWIRLFKRGDTEYTIHPFPLGGFVKLAGQEPGEEDIPNGFNSKPWWQRYLVYLAGPVMSFVLAYLVFCVFGMTIGLPVPKGLRNRVDLVMPDTEADRAGLRTGDVVVSIDGKPIENGVQMLDTIHGSSYKRLHIVVRREGELVNIEATPKPQMMEFAKSGFLVNLPMMKTGDEGNRIDAVERKSLAEKAGLKPGDVLVSLNGKRVVSGGDIISAAGLPVSRLTLVVDRDNKLVSIRMPSSPKDLKVLGLLGFMPTQTYKRVGFAESIRVGNQETVDFAKTLVTVLFSRHVKDTVGGPIAIADQTSIAVRRGIHGFLQLLAMLSLSLGVVNLLPIPVMDGGQMALLIGEAIKGRRLSQKTMEIATKLGLAIIAMFFLLIMFVDLTRVAQGKFFR